MSGIPEAFPFMHSGYSYISHVYGPIEIAIGKSSSQ
jgi:hypothetical protein